jgi:cytochrome b561
MKSPLRLVTDPAAADDQPRAFVIRQYRMPAKVMHWITAVLVLCMFASGVIAKQLSGGAVADMLMSFHKLTGVTILVLVVTRLVYRITRPLPEWKFQAHRQPVLHWTLYTVAVVVPLLGWAGISDFGAREVFAGYSLPAIWPEGAGYDRRAAHRHRDPGLHDRPPRRRGRLGGFRAILGPGADLGFGALDQPRNVCAVHEPQQRCQCEEQKRQPPVAGPPQEQRRGRACGKPCE